MSPVSPTRSVAEQLDLNRRWLICFLLLQMLTCTVLLLIGWGLLRTSLTNREVGYGNRHITCTILDRVDATAQVAECAPLTDAHR